MKKTAIPCLAILFCICLAACGGGTPDGNFKARAGASRTASGEETDSAGESIEREFGTEAREGASRTASGEEIDSVGESIEREFGTEAREGASQMYSGEEIDSAIETIRSEFGMKWKGCTLTEIYYAGDAVSKEYQDWADRNDANEVIVLLSAFEVDASGGDGSLNPNSTYDHWNWILVRTDGGKWVHVDHGY